MAIVYTKNDQGRYVYVCDSAPVHSANSGDTAIDVTNGVFYIYTTSWIALGSGGGGGATNLSYIPAVNDGTVTSDTGTDATIPLADATNAGLILAAEKTKLAGIQAGAEVNVNADWNANSGDAEILNKPTIPSITGLATTSYVDTQDDLKVDKVTGSRLITSAESTLIGNTSGTNTGDNAINTLYSGLAASKQDAITLTTTGTSGAATLIGSTLNVPQYSGGGGSPAVAFSPMSISVCDTAPTSGTTQYYYQTISEVTGTISKVKLWGYAGTDTVYFGLYRGVFGSLTLIGQGSAVCSTGPNEITLTAEAGQTLDLTVGEDLVVGFYPAGTSWRTIYDIGISDTAFGLTNTANITTMPATPTGGATAIRFACTLYS